MTRTWTILRKGLHDRSGATAVEFALILPLVLLTIFGMIEFGRMLWIRNTMEYVAETAARYGGINTTKTQAEIEAYALTKVIGIDPAGWSWAVDTQSTYVSVSISYNYVLLTSGVLNISPVTLVATARFPRVAI